MGIELNEISRSALATIMLEQYNNGVGNEHLGHIARKSIETLAAIESQKEGEKVKTSKSRNEG